MRSRITEWMEGFSSGGGGLVLLFLELLVAVVLIGWAYNRGFRPTDRGPLVRWPLLIIGYGLALVVQHVHQFWWQPLIIAVAVVVAGFFGRSSYSSGLGVPVMLLATLLGYGLILSAIALTVLTVLVLALSPAGKR